MPPFRSVIVSIFLVCSLWVARPGLLAAQERQPIDRILAVVDDDPILASEVRQILALGVVEPREGDDETATQRRALNFLIEQKLRFHEVDRYGFAELPIEVIDEELDLIRARFDSEEEFRERLAELSLAERSLRQIVARQVMVWIYVEERLGARVFVGLDDVQRYYDEVFVPQLVEQRQTVPPLQAVREPIGVVLREQRMNDELERWTLELHQQADIEDFFDSRHASPPPVVFTVGGKSD